MNEALVGATVQVGLQNALTLIQEIITMAWYYEDYLADLKISLEMVQGFLCYAETNKDSYRTNNPVKLWLHQLEDLAFEADTVLDAVKYKLLRRQVKNKETGFLTSVASKCCLRVFMSCKFKNILTKLKEINERASGFGLHNNIAEASQTAGLITINERETDSLSIEAYVEGRDDDVKKIVEMLITAQSEAAKISVISIWGMGGLGKTTVARKVFNHEKMKDQFGLKMWVCVSDFSKFDSLSLYKLILGTLTDQQFVNASRDTVVKNLKECLEDKRYLLILDDVWDENSGHWDEFKNTLSNISSDKENRIVVTTRNQSVASHVGTLTTYQLSGLSQSQCWSIIKSKSFGGEDVPKEFVRIGKNIARRCDGLPLAAKVIGGLLHKKSVEYWHSISEHKLFDGDDENITKILRLSYNNLPTLSLKKCFAYCSVFPQDYKIERQKMVELWMAEGFLQVGQEGDMETAGSEVFNRLLQYSLFQDANRDKFDDIVDCKMHDLVHDIACSITKDMSRVRYLALKAADANEPNAISQRQKMKYLRTMLFDGEIANNMFSNFRCLHVLKLTTRGFRELPSGIEKLIHLRSLDFSSTQFHSLPDSIGKLYHLQTLVTNPAKLPNTIINLVSLRHLHISKSTKLPPWIGKVSSLRTLKHYRVYDENGCGIRELGSLKNLQGELKIDNLEMVKDKEDAEFADLSGKAGIFKLTLSWNESTDRVGDDTNVLDGLQPHRRLKYLEIFGYNGKTLPYWTKSMATPACNNNEIQAFNSLVEIRLNYFTQCEELPMLGHLRRLRFLSLQDWHNLRCIGLSLYGIESLGVRVTVFPALERLEMDSMPELTEWVELNSANIICPRLKYLKISRCRKLKSVPSHFHCLEKFEGLMQYVSLQFLELDSLPVELFVNNQNLIDLDIRYCPELRRLVPNSVGGGGASLKRLGIWCCENLIELPDDLNMFSKLEVLSIHGCHGLKSIPCSTSLTSLKELDVSRCQGLTELPINNLTSLERLSIGDCKGLKSIPYGTSLTSLRELNISDCKGLTNLPIGLLESSLESIRLSDLEELDNLDTLIPCLGRMPRLQKLGIEFIPKFNMERFMLSGDSEFACLRILKTLRIGGFSEPMNEDQLTRVLRKCPSLENLGLSWDKNYDTLIKMDSIQHLNLHFRS